MAFCKTTIHVVQPGDTYYRLAQRYKTTVPEIIIRNPGVNPYNLQVGTRLTICTGPDYNTVQMDELGLSNDMRKAWAQYIYWMRMYMTSLYNQLGNLEPVEERLMQTPQAIAGVFESFYPSTTSAQMIQLLEEHLVVGKELMKALQNNEMARAEQLERQWRQNADKIARLLSSINREYDYEEISGELSGHLDMLKRQSQESLNMQYGEAIRLFDQSVDQIMNMADYLSKGLLGQFYTS